MEDDDQQPCIQNTKPLNQSDLKRIFDETLGSYDRCSENIKFTLCSLALSTKEISNSDGRSWGIMGSDTNNESFNLEVRMKDIINKHKNSIMSKEDSFHPANMNLMPASTQLRKTTSKRLRSKRDQVIQKVRHQNKIDVISQLTIKKNKRVKHSCTFCGSNEPGENIKNCIKRKHLQRLAKEYTIGKNGNQLDDFLRKIEFDHVFKTVQNKRLNICVLELSRYELSKFVAKFFNCKYCSYRDLE